MSRNPKMKVRNGNSSESPKWREIDFVALFEKQCMAH